MYFPVKLLLLVSLSLHNLFYGVLLGYYLDLDPGLEAKILGSL